MMRRPLLLVSGLAACLGVAGAKLVPGKAFDRLITIWLENQVRLLRDRLLGGMR